MDPYKIRPTILNAELQYQMSTEYVVGMGTEDESGQT
jgi:hypothetical protein